MTPFESGIGCVDNPRHGEPGDVEHNETKMAAAGERPHADPPSGTPRCSPLTQKNAQGKTAVL